jgi:hypothetical protein
MEMAKEYLISNLLSLSRFFGQELSLPSLFSCATLSSFFFHNFFLLLMSSLWVMFLYDLPSCGGLVWVVPLFLLKISS